MNFASKETILNYIFKFVNLYELKVNNQLSIINFIPYFAIIFFLICNLITIIIHSKNEKNYLLLILFVAIYGSQYSMMLAPYTPLRTCLTAIIFLIFAIIYLINYLKDQHFDFIKIVPIIFMYINFNIAIILYIFIDILLLNKNMKKLLLILSIVPFAYFSAYNYKNIYVNYHENKLIYNYNIEKIQNYKSGNKTIYLKRLFNETYAFTPLIGQSWIEKGVKTYFHIPNNVQLKYEGE